MVNRRPFLIAAVAFVASIPARALAEIGYHTHTCKRGHTWDHALNSSHNCRFKLADGKLCWLYQADWDNPVKAVTKPHHHVERAPVPRERLKKELLKLL